MNQTTYAKLSEAASSLKERLKTMTQEIPAYTDAEKNHISETWLTITWQTNLDIHRIRKLMNEYRYDPRFVSDGELHRLHAWLLKKYDINILDAA